MKKLFNNLVLMLCLAIPLGCNDDDSVQNEQKNPKPFGEREFIFDQPGNTPIYFSKAQNGKFMLSGYLGKWMESEKPFLAIFSDTLRLEKLVYPAFDQNMTKGRKVVDVSDGYILLSENSSAVKEEDLGGVFLSKISLDGKLQWSKVYLKNTHVSVNSITSNHRDIVYVAASNYPQDTAHYCSILKLDGNGTLLWEKKTTGFQTFDLIETEDGSLVYEKDSVYISNENGGAQRDIPIITKVDQNGNEVWRVKFSNDYGLWWKTTLAPTAENGVIVLSKSFKTIMKVNSLGTVVWSTELSDEAMVHFDGFTDVGCIFIDSEGGIYILATSSGCGRNIVAVKFDADGKWVKSAAFGGGEGRQRAAIAMTENQNGELVICAREKDCSGEYPYYSYKTIFFKSTKDFKKL